MAYTTDNKAITAFKNLLNKAMTDANKELGNEAEGSFFNIDSSTIFTDEINENPSIAVTNGVAVKVVADMALDLTSNGHALFAEWPITAPTGIDQKTGLNFAYGAGSLLNVAPGQRVKNSISPAYGASYEAKPYTSGASLIPPGDPIDWIYQYQSGIFFRQDIGTTPSTIELYVYIGNYLKDALLNISVDSATFNLLDKDMTANTTSIDGDLAVAAGITDIPVSTVRVLVNGLEVNVGPGKECYFADANTPFTVRNLGEEEQGDLLYWNGSVANYELSNTDQIDYIYLVNN